MTDEKIMSTIKPDGECWQPEIEKMPREQLQQLQVKKLKDTINVCLKSPFYKKQVSAIKQRFSWGAVNVDMPKDKRKAKSKDRETLLDFYIWTKRQK